MMDNDSAPATAAAPKQRRKRKTTAPATKARTARAGYKAEAMQLRSEVERLKGRIRTLESRTDSGVEQGLLLRTATDSFQKGVETGLILQK